jgi:glyoxylate carboligase
LDYFKNVSQLPSFEELEESSKVLFDLYTSSSAHYEAIDDVRDGSSEWVQTVPLGSVWDAAAIKTSNTFTTTEIAHAQKQAARAAKKKNNKKKKNTLSQPADRPFNGDRVFAEAATFKQDAMYARELGYAASDGDVGRMWECIKVRKYICRLIPGF